MECHLFSGRGSPGRARALRRLRPWHWWHPAPVLVLPGRPPRASCMCGHVPGQLTAFQMALPGTFHLGVGPAGVSSDRLSICLRLCLHVGRCRIGRRVTHLNLSSSAETRSEMAWVASSTSEPVRKMENFVYRTGVSVPYNYFIMCLVRRCATLLCWGALPGCCAYPGWARCRPAPASCSPGRCPQVRQVPHHHRRQLAAGPSRSRCLTANASMQNPVTAAVNSILAASTWKLQLAGATVTCRDVQRM